MFPGEHEDSVDNPPPPSSSPTGATGTTTAKSSSSKKQIGYTQDQPPWVASECPDYCPPAKYFMKAFVNICTLINFIIFAMTCSSIISNTYQCDYSPSLTFWGFEVIDGVYGYCPAEKDPAESVCTFHNGVVEWAMITMLLFSSLRVIVQEFLDEWTNKLIRTDSLIGKPRYFIMKLLLNLTDKCFYFAAFTSGAKVTLGGASCFLIEDSISLIITSSMLIICLALLIVVKLGLCCCCCCLINQYTVVLLFMVPIPCILIGVEASHWDEVLTAGAIGFATACFIFEVLWASLKFFSPIWEPKEEDESNKDVELTEKRSASEAHSDEDDHGFGKL